MAVRPSPQKIPERGSEGEESEKEEEEEEDRSRLGKWKIPSIAKE